MFNKPLQGKKYGRQHKLNYTSIPSAFSLTKKLNLVLKHRNCRSGGSTPSDMGGGGEGGGHPDPDMRGKGRSQKKFFSALRASVWFKNKEGGERPQAPPLDPPLCGHVTGGSCVGVV